MAYFIQTDESVEAYIYAVEGFSDEGKRKVIEGYLGELAERAEHFLERYPVAHESYTFQYEYALIDGDRIYAFRFVADGSHMPMGVVRVIYVDHDKMPLSS